MVGGELKSELVGGSRAGSGGALPRRLALGACVLLDSYLILCSLIPAVPTCLWVFLFFSSLKIR